MTSLRIVCILFAILWPWVLAAAPDRKRFEYMFRTAHAKQIHPDENITAPLTGTPRSDSSMASTLLRAAAHYDRRAATARTLQSIQSVRGALVNAWSLAPFKSRNTAANRIAFILRSVNITKLAHAANASTAVRALRQGQFGQRASGLRTAVVTGWRAYNRSGLGPRHMLSPAAVAARVRGYWAWSMRHAETVLDRVTAETDRIEPIEEDGAEEDGTSSDARIALGTLVPFAVSLMDIDASKWQLLSEKSGIKVFRCLAPQLPSGASSRWPCYRACSIIAGTPSDVAQLLFDSSKVHLINRYSAGRTDVEVIDEGTKIVHNRILDIIGVRKPHDFCTLLHLRTLPDGTVLLISVAVNHTSAPVSDAYLRSKILFGLNIMRPLQCNNSINMTEVTSISHVQYANVSPYVVGYSMPFGMYSFMLQLKSLFSDGVLGSKSMAKIHDVTPSNHTPP